MATTYYVKITDRLLRFDTTADDVEVILLPFAQTPNAPYEVYKTTVGDGHTVTITAQSPDFLLPNASPAVVLDDTNYWAIIKIPDDGASPAFVTQGGSGGGGGGGGAVNTPAPPVQTPLSPAEVFPRDNGQVEVDVAWTAAASATAINFHGVQVYLEDPDISSGSDVPLDGSYPLDGSGQVSGVWTPVPVNQSTASPAVVLLDATSVAGSQAARTTRNIRIYLASFGPYSQPILVRHNQPNPTPSILVEIEAGPDQNQSGMEWAFLIQTIVDGNGAQTSPAVAVTADYGSAHPGYYLTYTYTPPDPSVPLPQGVNRFGGARIVNVQEDASGNPIFPGTDTGISVPVAQSQSGFKTQIIPATATGVKYRAYFCSEDNASPLGSHVNSLVPGVTPYAEVVIPQVNPAPPVSNFTISGQKTIWLPNSYAAEALLSWNLPTAAANGARYAGVAFYLVNVTGSVPPLTTFPKQLGQPQSNSGTNYPLEIFTVPANPEVWTIAAISVDPQGQPADLPGNYNGPGWSSPTVQWAIAPPTGSTPGGGIEFAPLVTLNAGATATANPPTVSADGVSMISFKVGTWTNPTDNQFGGAQVAMVIGGDTTKPTFWTVPANATSFTTPSIVNFGTVGQSGSVDFYIVSDDPQGNKNSIRVGTTPVISIPGGYVPVAGAIIPARSGWFDESQFSWDGTTGNVFKADKIEAQYVFVDSVLRVGGGTSALAPSFGGQQNGQIAVYNSSNVLRGWIGEQQNTQGDGTQLYGAWFAQLWVGGAGPLTAPLFVNSAGIIEVGGIAAANGATYPYLSIRDNTGVEAGRIGAMLSSANDGSGNVGPSPPNLTAGAWFTQLAVGGSTLTNWNVLITPDPNNLLGSNFQIRNINKLSIDYAAQQSVAPFNAEYRIDFGNSVWATAGMSGYQFPGIKIYEVDNNQNAFGSVFLSRGIVIRGPQGQTYPVLASLTAWNGQSSGVDTVAGFWGILTLASPVSPFANTVVIGGGSASTNDGYITVTNANGVVTLAADSTGCKAVTFSTTGYGTVIDAAGNWKGVPISGGGQPQTPWATDIAGAGHNLTNVGSIQVNGGVTAGALTSNGALNTVTASISSTASISGALTAAGATFSGEILANGGLDAGAGAVYASFIATNQHGGTNEVDTGTLKVSSSIIVGSATTHGVGTITTQSIIYGGAQVYGTGFGIVGNADAPTQDVSVGGVNLRFKGGLFYGTF